MKHLLISTMVLCCIYFNALTAQTLTQNQIDSIEYTVKKEMKASGTPGVALAIINHNKVVYENSFGLSNTQTKVKMTDTTIFQIASVTKMFTAMTLLTELKKAHIDVHEPVGKVVQGLSPKLSSLTFHQLLTHTSGMMDIYKEDDSPVLNFFRNIGDSVLFIEPGKVFSYSNLNYALISSAIEQLSGKSYPSAVEADVIRPLHLKNTTFDILKVVCTSFSVGHYYSYRTKKIMPYIHHFELPLLQPAGGIFSNLRDMEQVAFCLMNHGRLDGKQVIDSSIVSQMSFPHAKNFTAAAPSYYGFVSYPDNAYGYGLFMHDYGSLHFIGNGGAATQMTYFLYEPGAKFSMIFTSNLNGELFITSFKKIWQVVLNEAEPVQADMNFDKNEREKIVGTYILPSLDKTKKRFARVVQKEDKLYINFNGSQDIKLEQIGQMAYRYSVPYSRFPLEIEFYTDETNKVAYLRNYWRTWVKVD